VVFQSLDLKPDVSLKVFNVEFQVHSVVLKLRHKVLFRESLIWVVGRWTSPHFTGLSDRRLRQVGKSAYGEISTMVSRSTSRTIDLALIANGPNYWSSDLEGGILFPNQEERWEPEVDCLSDRPALNLPKFFGKIVDTNELPYDVDISDLYLTELLENNLMLAGQCKVAGKDDVDDYFLCANIEDEDLP
jgi:hypothetical protein